MLVVIYDSKSETVIMYSGYTTIHANAVNKSIGSEQHVYLRSISIREIQTPVADHDTISQMLQKIQKLHMVQRQSEYRVDRLSAGNVFCQLYMT